MYSLDSLTIYTHRPSPLVSSLYDVQCLYGGYKYRFFSGWPALVYPCLRVHGTSLTSFFTSLVVPSIPCSSWMVCKMGCNWAYNVVWRVLLLGFVQNSMQHPCIFLSRFFSNYFVCVQVVQTIL